MGFAYYDSERGGRSALDPELERELWPHEDYELARSLVDTTLPEDDLFTGITEKVTV